MLFMNTAFPGFLDELLLATDTAMHWENWSMFVYVMVAWWYQPNSYTDVNTLRPKQNGRNFPDDIFKCYFLNGNV